MASHNSGDAIDLIETGITRWLEKQLITNLSDVLHERVCVMNSDTVLQRDSDV
jgi:hypothetical protein